jgi:hypothetical protein
MFASICIPETFFIVIVDTHVNMTGNRASRQIPNFANRISAPAWASRDPRGKCLLIPGMFPIGTIGRIPEIRQGRRHVGGRLPVFQRPLLFHRIDHAQIVDAAPLLLLQRVMANEQDRPRSNQKDSNKNGDFGFPHNSCNSLHLTIVLPTVARAVALREHEMRVQFGDVDSY